MKPIKKNGRVSRERQARRRKWIREHPPTHAHEGAWDCHICGEWVYEPDMELDHVLPKSSTPKDIAESDANLKPAHKWCNSIKGSRRL